MVECIWDCQSNWSKTVDFTWGGVNGCSARLGSVWLGLAWLWSGSARFGPAQPTGGITPPPTWPVRSQRQVTTNWSKTVDFTWGGVNGCSARLGSVWLGLAWLGSGSARFGPARPTGGITPPPTWPVRSQRQVTIYIYICGSLTMDFGLCILKTLY